MLIVVFHRESVLMFPGSMFFETNASRNPSGSGMTRRKENKSKDAYGTFVKYTNKAVMRDTITHAGLSIYRISCMSVCCGPCLEFIKLSMINSP